MPPECLSETVQYSAGSRSAMFGGEEGSAASAGMVGRRLELVRGRLDGVLGSIESTFLGAGEKLATAIDSLQAVTGTFDQLATIVGSEALDDTVRGLEHIPEVLASASSANERNAVALQRLDSLARGLDRPLARLRKTIAEVQVLAINGRVEAAHVNAVSTDFSVFTRDMGMLASQATAALDRLSRELDQLNRLAAAARSNRDAVVRHEGEALAEVASRLRTSVDAVASRRRETAEAACLVGELSRANAASIGQAIGALQIGDIARQRVEHVAQALDNPDPGREGPLCRLQSMQLDHTRLELADEVGRARATFARLTTDAEAMRTRAAKAFRSGADGSRSFLHGLAADLRTALAAMEGYRRDASDLRTRLDPIIATVGEMAAHVRAVRDIEADMRIMGLNATLKCGRLGTHGRALGVIAQALRVQAGSTAESAAQVMAGLEEISAVTRGLGDSAADGAGEAVASLGAAVAAFENGGQTMGNALSILGDKVDEAVAALMDVRQRFDAESMVAALAAGARDLAALADDLGAPPGDDAWAQDLARSYTMASQREIHARFKGEGAGEAVDAEDAASLDDFFF